MSIGHKSPHLFSFFSSSCSCATTPHLKDALSELARENILQAVVSNLALPLLRSQLIQGLGSESKKNCDIDLAKMGGDQAGLAAAESGEPSEEDKARKR